jgi:hypothetical protein
MYLANTGCFPLAHLDVSSVRKIEQVDAFVEGSPAILPSILIRQLGRLAHSEQQDVAE